MVTLVYDLEEARMITSGPGRSWYWEGSDMYLLICHGDKNGCMFVVDNEEATEIDPWMLKTMLKEAIERDGKQIDWGKPTKVVCCYPKRVAERYESSLKYHNMFLIGDWDEPTHIGGTILFQVYSESEWNTL